MGIYPFEGTTESFLQIHELFDAMGKPVLTELENIPLVVSIMLYSSLLF